MKVLLINKYFYLPGGADKVFFDEGELLVRGGHAVGFFSMQHPRNLPSPFARYFVPEIDYGQKMGLLEKLKEAGRIVYSWEARKRLRRLLEREKFDVAHLHNIYHQLSPSILDELAGFDVPAVMTLHDYKMVCPTYNLFCRGRLCERCARGKYYHCLLQRCTKGSFTKSLVNVAEMYLHHRLLAQYNKVAVFISPSQFLKAKLAEMGFKREIISLPNFVRTKEFNPCFGSEENSVVYFGRLSREKGLFTLMDAMKNLKLTLKVIGEGPQREELEKKAGEEGFDNVRFLGFLHGRELHEEIRKSLFVVIPSEWPEIFGLVIIEGFALGKPVVGARIGAIPELVRDFETGLTFEPGNAQDLREKIRYLLGHPELVREMGIRARQVVEEDFGPEKHYCRLVDIYQSIGTDLTT